MGNVVPRRIAARDVRRCADQELIELLVAGNHSALEEMHRRYSETMLRTCTAVCRDDAEAADVFQDSLVAALRALRAGARPRDLRAWLVATSRNCARDALRRRRFEGTVPPALAAPSADDPAEQVLRREQLEILMGDLAQLSEAQRDALVLREFEGLSYDAIGATLSVSEAGARQRVTEARGALVALQRGRDMTCDEVQVRLLQGDGRTLANRDVRAHLDGCDACSAYAAAERRRRRRFAFLLPLGGLDRWRSRSGAWVAAGATTATVAAIVLIGGSGGGPAAARATADHGVPATAARALGATTGVAAHTGCVKEKGQTPFLHAGRSNGAAPGRAARSGSACERKGSDPFLSRRAGTARAGGAAPASPTTAPSHAAPPATPAVPHDGSGTQVASTQPDGVVTQVTDQPVAPAPTPVATAAPVLTVRVPTCQETFRGVGYGGVNDALAASEAKIVCPLDQAMPQLGLANRLNGALHGP